MPGFNGTGPLGTGPDKGRRAGYCGSRIRGRSGGISGTMRFRSGRGRNSGFGRGSGINRRDEAGQDCTLSTENQRDFILQETEILRTRLECLEGRLKTLNEQTEPEQLSGGN